MDLDNLNYRNRLNFDNGDIVHVFLTILGIIDKAKQERFRMRLGDASDTEDGERTETPAEPDEIKDDLNRVEKLRGNLMAKMCDYDCVTPGPALCPISVSVSVLLAKPDTAHLWTRANLEAMVKFALAEESEQSLVRSVDIIRDILGVGDRDLELDTVVELCEGVAYSESVRLAARGAELLTAMACGDTEAAGSLGDTACLAIQNLCYVASNGETEVEAGDTLVMPQVVICSWVSQI